MCTLQKRGDLYILTITGSDEHRLNPTRLDSIRSALAQIKSDFSSSPRPCALITTSEGKFFTNGYDLDWAQSDPTRTIPMSKKLRLLISDLISLPMPTIAAVTGHASASGFIIALCHDYLVMRSDRGFLYMSELDIGLKMPRWFVQVLKCKIADPKVWRDVVLTARKVTGEVGVQMGIVDKACVGAEETVEEAVRMGVRLVERGWDGKAYGENRATVFGDVLDVLGSDETVGDFGDGEDCKVVSKL